MELRSNAKANLLIILSTALLIVPVDNLFFMLNLCKFNDIHKHLAKSDGKIDSEDRT